MIFINLLLIRQLGQSEGKNGRIARKKHGDGKNIDKYSG